MKRTLCLIGLLGLLALSVQPLWARCAPLIKEGRQLLTTAKVGKAEESKAKSLLDEAQKNLDAGDHATGVKNANAALDILRKK
jgi:hypothetical protein